MKNIFFIICSTILTVFSLNEITPKLCINCKFFTNNFLKNNRYGKCTLYPTTKIDVDYYVTGIKKDFDFYYCSIVRDSDNMCGKEGKKFINKFN